MNNFSALKIIPVFLLVLLFLAACSSSAPVAPPAQAVGEATLVIEQATSQPVAETSPTEASTDPAAPAEVVEPTPRPDLHASDPSTVSLASGQLQLVEFFAFWWVTCQSMAPVVHGLEANYAGRVFFSYLDTDDPANDPFKQTLGYRVQPHFFLLDGQGNILKQWLGGVSAEEFASEFEAALAQ